MKNDAILGINSPKQYLDGPHDVVYTSMGEGDEGRWAVVTLKWEGKPRLGVRWFHGKHGYPLGHFGYGTWYVVPPMLSKGLLASLPLAKPVLEKTTGFLREENE